MLHRIYSVSGTGLSALYFTFNSLIAVFYLKKPRLREVQ